MRKDSPFSFSPDKGPDPAAEDFSDVKKPSDSYVQSFARGLSVIRSFNEEFRTQTVAQVAQNTGLTRAGARRILLTLEGLGYVTSKHRQFQLTAKILELGFAYLSSMPFFQLAQPVVTELTRTTGESSSLAVLDNTDIVYVIRIPARKIMAVNISVGTRLSAFSTSMGRVLLASLPNKEVDRILSETPLEAHTPYTVTDPANLKRILADVRHQGWCLSFKETHEGLIALAVPIFDRSGKVAAALNVSGYSYVNPEEFRERCLPSLLDAAQRVSALLL